MDTALEHTARGVQIDRVNKWYGQSVHAVRDVSMAIGEGEFMVFVGPSGCGKTTLLRMLAGLEGITSGDILMDGRVVNRVPPRRRDVAMVFQNYALYPNMDVRGNIAFPLKMRRVKAAQAAGEIDAVARKLELEGLLARRPAALSGGQRQRVALARAMVRQPRLFLMDEPLSNLDAKLRVDMRREIVKLQRELGVTTVYVTHDQTEAMTMGHRIAVMHQGVLQQVDAPSALYHRPQNLFVAGFIGSPPMNLWPGRLIWDAGGPTLHMADTDRAVPLPPEGVPPQAAGRDVWLGLRPEHLSPTSPGQPWALPTQVDAVENTGRESMVYLKADGLPDLTMAASGELSIAPGQPLWVAPRPRQLHVFDGQTGARI